MKTQVTPSEKLTKLLLQVHVALKGHVKNPCYTQDLLDQIKNQMQSVLSIKERLTLA